MIKYIFNMQKEQELPERIKLFSDAISNCIKRGLALDSKQPGEVIPWEEFRQLNLTFDFGNQRYGVNLKEISQSSPEVIAFLERLIKARQEEREEPGQWKAFLDETSELSDEFFNQPLGQFEDPNVRPITLSQLNMSLLTILDKGVVFHFNSNHKNE